jgi:hypothetical protein
MENPCPKMAFVIFYQKSHSTEVVTTAVLPSISQSVPVVLLNPNLDVKMYSLFESKNFYN